jgi:hypothetical protein
MASARSLHPQVDVNYNEETRKKVHDGQYLPAPDDQELDEMDLICDVWERPPVRHLHVFIRLPHGGGITETCEWLFSSSFWAIWSCSSVQSHPTL